MTKKGLGFAKSNTWDTGTGVRCTDTCEWAEESESMYTIYIPLSVYNVIRKLCKDIKLEWQLLLLGTINDIACTVNITGYYVPKQQVSAGSVNNLDCIDKTFIDTHGVVATMHSHASMAVHFSTTDDTMTNMGNIRHHIVVNNDGDTKAVSRIQTPCGKEAFVDASVEYELPAESAVEVVGIENIEEIKYTHPKTPSWEADDDFDYISHYKGDFSKRKHALSQSNCLHFD